MFPRAEQRGRHGKWALALQRLDRHAGGEPGMNRQTHYVVGRALASRSGCPKGDHVVVRPYPRGRDRILRLTDDLERARAVGKPANEATLFERRYKPVNP